MKQNRFLKSFTLFLVTDILNLFQILNCKYCILKLSFLTALKMVSFFCKHKLRGSTSLMKGGTFCLVEKIFFKVCSKKIIRFRDLQTSKSNPWIEMALSFFQMQWPMLKNRKCFRFFSLSDFVVILFSDFCMTSQFLFYQFYSFMIFIWTRNLLFFVKWLLDFRKSKFKQ